MAKFVLLLVAALFVAIVTAAPESKNDGVVVELPGGVANNKQRSPCSPYIDDQCNKLCQSYGYRWGQCRGKLSPGVDCVCHY